MDFKIHHQHGDDQGPDVQCSPAGLVLAIVIGLAVGVALSSLPVGIGVGVGVGVICSQAAARKTSINPPQEKHQG